MCKMDVEENQKIETDFPKVSIIIPVYKVEKYIERCLRSVMAQTYEGELECILVDDCSPDQSIEIARKILASYQGKIGFTIVQQPANRGLSAARNTGIRKATGDYLYFLDSDDEITPDAMEILANLAVRYKGVELVYGNLYVSEPKKFLFICPSVQEYFSDPVRVKKMMLKRKEIPVIACNKLIQRTFILQHHLWFVEGLLHEDEVWNFFAAKYVKSFAVSSTATYVYYQNDSSIMSVASLGRVNSLLKIADIFIRHRDSMLCRLQRKWAIEMGYHALGMLTDITERETVKSKSDLMRQTFKPFLISAICRFRILELWFLMPFYLSPVFLKFSGDGIMSAFIV